MKVKFVGNFYKLVNFACGKNSFFLITLFPLAGYLHSDHIRCLTIKCQSCHHIETSQLICSIDWFLYDGNFGV